MSNDISVRSDPKLLIQGFQDVYIQKFDLLMDPDLNVYASNQNITGMNLKENVND